MDFFISVLVALHILGLAVIVGPFLLFMRAKSGFPTLLPLIGSIVQLVTGLGLVGLLEATDAEINHVKIAVKLLIAIVVFVGALIAFLRQRKVLATPGGAPEGAERKAIMPWFHVAGGFAFINVLVATLWR